MSFPGLRVITDWLRGYPRPPHVEVPANAAAQAKRDSHWMLRHAYYWLQGFPWPQPEEVPAESALESFAVSPDRGGHAEAIRVTGESLIRAVYDAIEARRPVLLTGPRGSGKSYCAEEGIYRAMGSRFKNSNNEIQTWPKLIRGFKFLQGNREFPRDSLSEDSLFIGDEGRPEMLTALAMRAVHRPREGIEKLPVEGNLFIEADDRSTIAKKGDEAAQAAFCSEREKHIRAIATWPAIPQSLVDCKKIREYWLPSDWAVLYLDEINRFGDGFLDSLLSLTEEGKIVRRGETYFIPLVVVATANPAGYDPTAKKLSPPLQARISRSYRVSQPGLVDLLFVIDDKRTQLYKEFADQPPQPGEQEGFLELAALASAATLLTWGDPGTEEQRKLGVRRGAMYLTAGTREWLREVVKLDPRPKAADSLPARMKEISELIEFGCDARAVQDWIGRACERARERTREAGGKPQPLRRMDLVNAAVEVLGHKVRENFSEGASPHLVLQKEEAIVELVKKVMYPLDGQSNDGPIASFVKLVSRAVRALAKGASEAEVWKAVKPLGEALHKRPPGEHLSWLKAIANLESGIKEQHADGCWVYPDAGWIDRFKTSASGCGRFQRIDEIEWFNALYCQVHGIPEREGPFQTKGTQVERLQELVGEGDPKHLARLLEVHKDAAYGLSHAQAFEPWLDYAAAAMTATTKEQLYEPLLRLHLALLEIAVESKEERWMSRCFDQLALKTCPEQGGVGGQAASAFGDLDRIPGSQWERMKKEFENSKLLPTKATLRAELELRQKVLRLLSEEKKSYPEVLQAMRNKGSSASD